MIIDTGAPRSIKGHAISGAIASLIINKEKDTKKIIKNSLKGALVASCSIGAANALGNNDKNSFKNIIEALGYISIGIAGFYAINQLFKGKENE